MTTDQEEQQRAIRRRGFFDYIRLRIKTASSSDLQLPDRLILLGALFDALANHWWSTSQKTTLGGPERMHRFLLAHGGHAVFERVSTPLLHGETLEDSTRGELEKHFPFERYFRHRHEMKEVATWQDDPLFADLERIAGLKFGQLVGCTFGGLFYTRLRNPWLHDLYPSRFDMEILAGDGLVADGPYYHHVVSAHGPDADHFLLAMPIAFVIATAIRAAESFEREATEGNILPFRGGH